MKPWLLNFLKKIKPPPPPSTKTKDSIGVQIKKFVSSLKGKKEYPLTDKK